MTSFLDYLAGIARSAAAVVVAVLPSRHWHRVESLPVVRMALPSAILTGFAGAALEIRNYFHYMKTAGDATASAALNLAQKQIHGQFAQAGEFTTQSLSVVSMYSMIGAMLFTPVGLFSTYLVLSAVLRVAGWVVEQPSGDPILSGIDALSRRIGQRANLSYRHRKREWEEGREVPDRLVTGARAGLQGVDLVVIASRRKQDWTAGTFVITPGQWYRLGEPYDMDLPEGLRTAYPLVALQTNEVLRRGVRYELPALDGSPGVSR